jgi:hypothetical protein
MLDVLSTGSPITDDVIVVVPGILGSVLARADRILWGTLPSIARVLITGGRELRLPADIGDNPSSDGIRATSLISVPALIPALIGADGYDSLVRFMQKRLGLDTRQILRFPYDWRLSNRLNAQRLKDAAESSLNAWRQMLTTQARDRLSPDPKLIFVCHSMGGLVARYYLEVLGGHKHTRRLITIGTPHQGSPKALNFLLGQRWQAGPFTVDATDLVRSLPSIYQMIPTYPSVRESNKRPLSPPDTVKLANVSPDLVRDGIRFHQQIQDEIAQRGTMQPGYATHVIGGVRHPTPTKTTLTGLDEADSGIGDGTVPGRSALPPEWKGDTTGAMFVPKLHARLHAEGSVLDQIEGILTMQKFQYLGDRPQFGLEIPDMVQVGAALTLLVKADPDEDNLALEARVVDEVEAPVMASSPLLNQEGGRYRGSIRIPSAGIYRVTVAEVPGMRPVEPVTAIVLVWDDSLGG